MSVPLVIFSAILALGVGAWLQSRLTPKTVDTKSSEAERQKVLDAAKREAEQLKRSAELEAKEVALRLSTKAEEELRKRRAELQRKESEIDRKETDISKRDRTLANKISDAERKERSLQGREQSVEQELKRAEELVNEAKGRLEKVAGLTAEQARAELSERMLEQARRDAAKDVKRIEETAMREAEEKSKQILGAAIQRYASDYVGERTVSVVPLPSDELKGRIIGREGRNVRALEAATGIDLIIDDTPEAVVISCFNPMRREIAKMALEKLMTDGRIHPTRIEEVVAKCEDEIELRAKEAGEQAVFDLGLHKVHPELVRALGRLKFRTTQAQNVLQHSIEVGILAGAMAGELGLNVKIARRAGLLHDLGRSVDHEFEGSHSQVGAQLARKYNEAPQVVAAIAEHHGEEAPSSVLSHLVQAANILSGQRPGARREHLASYISRLHDLEKLAQTFPGVERVFAISAGSEVRVLVENAKISDEQSILLAKDIAKKIEDESTYPGHVRVSVVRETRAVDYAK